MPFARIITRFDAGAHELALLLLERGYAVEIVSPDSIPDNFADLELRLDNDSGDELVSNVKAQSNGHTASFDFVHRLKTPIGDFPVVHEEFRPLEIPVTFNAERVSEVEPVAAASEVALPEPVTEPSPSTPEASTISMSPAVPVATPTCESPQRSRSAWLYGRAALACASVVLLALFLVFGIRPSGTGVVQRSGKVDSSEVAAASVGGDALKALDVAKEPQAKEPQKKLEKESAKGPGISLPVAGSSSPVKPEGNSRRASGKSPAPKIAAGAGSSRPRSRSESSGRHGDGLIARDTVTYLDGRYRPAPKTKSQSHVARRQPASRKHGGVIAANTVTYLDTKPSSQPAK